ncbi:hypothetical protein G3T20_13120 [Bordetella hinzii]|uniref:hypothetical protein n=1 Tax=Bordetella hinzii TaxID=103855 RepID=UPI001150E5AC|nr:hypothetical protein [Bordetella hinzii]QDJ34088.1 hypothetical protein CBR68_18045 [Bordetella hinzii]QII85532.1 hypothetical protein G3T20_13120 [Bordetella hinzii]
MTLIIAAHYDSFDQAGAAARQLFDQGFPVADMHTFYVNPPGGQAPQPSGSDTAAEAPAGGAWLGAVLLGAAAASAAALALAPAWAVILLGAAGAYLGSLGGALARRARRPARRHGVLLALRVDPRREAEGSRVLRAHGGEDLERADGRWSNGRWEDFDARAGG